MDAILITSAELGEESAGLSVDTVRDDNCMKIDLACHELAHRVDSDLLVARLTVQDDKNCRHSLVDLSVVEQVVGNARDGEALAVKVRQFLHLQAALLSHGFSDSLS